MQRFKTNKFSYAEPTHKVWSESFICIKVKYLGTLVEYVQVCLCNIKNSILYHHITQKAESILAYGLDAFCLLVDLAWGSRASKMKYFCIPFTVACMDPSCNPPRNARLPEAQTDGKVRSHTEVLSTNIDIGGCLDS